MAASHHVLLLGGNGKIAQILTPLLLKRSWDVTSIIRNPDQVPKLEKLGHGIEGSGKLNVLVRSLEDVTSVSQAKSLIDEVKPDYVVWSAGAGGKGAPERVRVTLTHSTILFHVALTVNIQTFRYCGDLLFETRPSSLIAMPPHTSSGRPSLRPRSPSS